MQVRKFPKAKRPLEYVSFFNKTVPIQQGLAFAYFGCDAYTGFTFHTGTELNEKPDTILKHISLLMENTDFLKHRDKGFTLVLDRFEELGGKIESIIDPVNGDLLIDKGFNAHISKEFSQGLKKMINKK